jgi:NADPH:quinone reductase-like Zn-dependent oxidoreductase
MKAWRLTMSDHSLELEDISDPSPRDGSILVRVQASS